MASQVPYCPIVIGGSVQLSAAKPQGPVDELRSVVNRFKNPMLIDEISLHRPASGDSVENVSLDLKVGQLRLTQGFVRASLLGRQENFYATAAQGFYQSAVWKFARPMLLGPSSLIVPQIRLDSIDNDATGNKVWFLMRGRALPPSYVLPAVSHVPLILPYEFSFAQGDVETSRSTAPQLINPEPVPLHCQRFVSNYRLTNGGEDSPVDGTNDLDVQIFHSNGQGLVKDPTPFWHLFGFPDKCWNNPFKLESREGVYVRMKNTGSAHEYTARIAIQGYRAVPVSEVF